MYSFWLAVPQDYQRAQLYYKVRTQRRVAIPLLLVNTSRALHPEASGIA